MGIKVDSDLSVVYNEKGYNINDQYPRLIWEKFWNFWGIFDKDFSRVKFWKFYRANLWFMNALVHNADIHSQELF